MTSLESLCSNLLLTICEHLEDSDIVCLISTNSILTQKINRETLWINRLIKFYSDELGSMSTIKKYKSDGLSWRSYYKEIKQCIYKNSVIFRSYNLDVSNLIKNNRIDLLKLLINRGRIFPTSKIRIDNRYLTILEAGCTFGYLDMIEYVLNEVDPRSQNNSAIGISSDKGHIPIVKILLDWKGLDGETIDPRSNLNYSLVYACRNGHIEIVKLLLDWKGPGGEYVDPRMVNNTPYAFSKMFHQDEISKVLLDWRGPGGEKVIGEYNLGILVYPGLVSYYCPYSE